jgi:hypothetical protein
MHPYIGLALARARTEDLHREARQAQGHQKRTVLKPFTRWLITRRPVAAAYRKQRAARAAS